MKKGKKGWILLMAFTMWTALITGCGKWTGNKPDKMPEDAMVGADTESTENQENSQSTPLPDIQELTYYVHGTMVEPIWSISLIRQEEGIELGIGQGLRVQIQKKLNKGKSLSQIADECEESEDTIRKIISEKGISE